MTKTELKIMSTIAVFKGIGETEINNIMNRYSFEQQTFQKGDVIYSPISYKKNLGIVLKGRILVSKEGYHVSELIAGSVFGAAALFTDESEYVSTLTAKTQCTVIFVSQDDFEQLMDQYPLIRMNYIRYISSRIRFLSKKVDALSGMSGEKKVTRYLIQHMDAQRRITPICSLTEMAAQLNVGRATLYRELDKLVQDGIISRQGKQIVVNKPEMLVSK